MNTHSSNSLWNHFPRDDCGDDGDVPMMNPNIVHLHNHHRGKRRLYRHIDEDEDDGSGRMNKGGVVNDDGDISMGTEKTGVHIATPPTKKAKHASIIMDWTLSRSACIATVDPISVKAEMNRDEKEVAVRKQQQSRGAPIPMYDNNNDIVRLKPGHVQINGRVYRHNPNEKFSRMNELL